MLGSSGAPAASRCARSSVSADRNPPEQPGVMGADHVAGSRGRGEAGSPRPSPRAPSSTRSSPRRKLARKPKYVGSSGSIWIASPIASSDAPGQVARVGKGLRPGRPRTEDVRERSLVSLSKSSAASPARSQHAQRHAPLDVAVGLLGIEFNRAFGVRQASLGFIEAVPAARAECVKGRDRVWSRGRGSRPAALRMFPEAPIERVNDSMAKARLPLSYSSIAR